MADDKNGFRIDYRPWGQSSSSGGEEVASEETESAKSCTPQSFYRFIDFLYKEVENITMLQAKVLMYVLLNPGVIQKEIVDLFGENAPTISRIIKLFGYRTVRDTGTGQLKQVGLDLIRTGGDPNDHRATTLHPTEKGKQLLAKIQGLR